MQGNCFRAGHSINLPGCYLNKLMISMIPTQFPLMFNISFVSLLILLPPLLVKKIFNI